MIKLTLRLISTPCGPQNDTYSDIHILMLTPVLLLTPTPGEASHESILEEFLREGPINGAS